MKWTRCCRNTGSAKNGCGSTVPAWIFSLATRAEPTFGELQENGYSDQCICFSAPSLKHPSCRIHPRRSEEHTSELQSLMRISYAVFCLKIQLHYTSIVYINMHYS